MNSEVPGLLVGGKSSHHFRNQLILTFITSYTYIINYILYIYYIIYRYQICTHVCENVHMYTYSCYMIVYIHSYFIRVPIHTSRVHMTYDNFFYYIQIQECKKNNMGSRYRVLYLYLYFFYYGIYFLFYILPLIKAGFS